MKASHPALSLLLNGLISFAAILPVEAQRMTKGLEHIRPRFGQQGTTVDVQFQGIAEALKNPRDVIIYRPGIRVIDLKPGPEPKRRSLVHGGYIDASVSARFEIDSDCPPGQYPFRLLTATELSLIGTFHVTPFRVIEETKESNDQMEAAMLIENNITLLGDLGGDGIDLYRLPVEKGQRLSLELNAIRIADRNYGDSEYDLALRVLDATGTELAQNDDNPFHIQDPVLSMLTPNHGDVYLEVKHSVYSTRGLVYALHVGSNARPTVAFPIGGQNGDELSFQLIGDAKGSFSKVLSIPQPPGNFSFFGDAPSPVLLRSSEFPNAFESDLTESALELPIALNGIIADATDKDAFRVSVEQGQAWRVRVYSASQGSPIDPRLTIHPIGPNGSPGTAEIEKDDSTLPERDMFGTSYRGGGGRREVLDPSVVWRPKQTGDYLIKISDTSGAGGPAGVYRIEIDALPTRFQTVLRSRSNDWVESMRISGFAIPRGGRCTVNITLQEGQFNRLKGEFDIVGHGLPPGVRLVSPRVKPGTKLWPVQLIAGNQAPYGGNPFTLEARPVDATQEFESRSQQNVPFLNHSGGNSLHYVQVDQYIAGVTDPAPFSVEIDAPSTPIVRKSEVTIPVRIRRKDGFTGEVQFAAGFVGAGIAAQPITSIPSDAVSAGLKLSIGGSAVKGQQPFVVIANNVHETLTPWLGTGHIHVSSEIVTLDIADPYLELTAAPTSIRRGERTRQVWRIQQLTPFQGRATARLLGLPKGLRVVEPLPTLTAHSKEVSFNLEATDEALLGRVTGLRCEVIVDSNGTEIVQRAGSGSIRVDPEAAAPEPKRGGI